MLSGVIFPSLPAAYWLRNSRASLTFFSIISLGSPLVPKNAKHGQKLRQPLVIRKNSRYELGRGTGQSCDRVSISCSVAGGNRTNSLAFQCASREYTSALSLAIFSMHPRRSNL